MKRKKQLVFIFSIMLSGGFGSLANANNTTLLENVYLDSKENILEDSNLSLGYRILTANSILKNTRFEQQLSRSISIHDSNSFDKTKMMSNVVYDFKKQNGIKTYIGAGVGVTHISSNDDGNKESDTSPSYQLITGVTYESPTNPNLKFDLGYSYSDKVGSEDAGNDLHLKQDNFKDEGGHAVSAAIRYTF